jgi:hypothetical protein
MPTVKAHRVTWDNQDWNGPTSEPDQYPNAKYCRSDIIRVKEQSSTNEVGYYKGVLWNSDLSTIESRVLLVAIHNGNALITGNYWVAKPCPPMCGDDGGEFVDPIPVEIGDIPTKIC